MNFLFSFFWVTMACYHVICHISKRISKQQKIHEKYYKIQPAVNMVYLAGWVCHNNGHIMKKPLNKICNSGYNPLRSQFSNSNQNKQKMHCAIT
ncbi:hypothetical protein DsansV1_C21g0165861 [Dioscorea sansibarensis]